MTIMFIPTALAADKPSGELTPVCENTYVMFFSDLKHDFLRFFLKMTYQSRKKSLTKVVLNPSK